MLKITLDLDFKDSLNDVNKATNDFNENENIW